MGILREFELPIAKEEKIDVPVNDIYVSDIESISSIGSSTIASSIATNIAQPRTRRNPFLAVNTLEIVPKKHLGSRKARRADNDRQLYRLVENIEGELEEDPAANLWSNADSPLSQLFHDTEKMNIWEVFTASTEEKQKDYLESMEKSKNKGGVHFAQKGPNKFSEKEKDGDYSPKHRFYFIPPIIRDNLIKGKFSLDEVRTVESELIKLFSSDPAAVYVSQDTNGFCRLMLHGICHYYRLSSESLELGKQKRVQIVNKKANFVVPTLTLSCYLIQRKKHT